MRRVAIVGNGGGGKSTLAARLGRAHDLPVHSVDQVQWRPDWVAAPTEEVSAVLDEWASGERWIIDGWGPMQTIERRLQRADAIIFVDFPLWMHFWLAAERQIGIARGIDRADPIAECDDLRVTRRLFETIWRMDQESRPKLVELIEANRAGKAFWHVRSVDELDEVCSSGFGATIGSTLRV